MYVQGKMHINRGNRLKKTFYVASGISGAFCRRLAFAYTTRVSDVDGFPSVARLARVGGE